MEERPDGRRTISVAHEKRDGPADVARWKAFRGDWLDALDEG